MYLSPPCLCFGGLPWLYGRYCRRRELGAEKGQCARIGTRDLAVGLEWVPKEEYGGKKCGALLHIGEQSSPDYKFDQLSQTRLRQSNPPSCACPTLSVFHSTCPARWAVYPIALIFHRWSGDRLVPAFLGFEHYTVICKPFGSFHFSSKHARMAVLAAWTIGIGISSPPFSG